MKYPSDLKYSKDHEWIKKDGAHYSVGVTQYAVEQLGDIVHLELPEVGASFNAGDPFGTIESTKTVSDLYLPIAGKVTETNLELAESPESLQNQETGEAWLVKVKASAPESSELMTAEQYEKFISED